MQLVGSRAASGCARNDERSCVRHAFPVLKGSVVRLGNTATVAWANALPTERAQSGDDSGFSSPSTIRMGAGTGADGAVVSADVTPGIFHTEHVSKRGSSAIVRNCGNAVTPAASCTRSRLASPYVHASLNSAPNGSVRHDHRDSAMKPAMILGSGEATTDAISGSAAGD